MLMTQQSEFDDIASRAQARTQCRARQSPLVKLVLMITLHDEAALDHLHCKEAALLLLLLDLR